MNGGLPLTGGDLRDLAETLDAIEATELAADRCIRSIIVALPACEDPVGEIVRFDETDPDMGWGIAFGDVP